MPASINLRVQKHRAQLRAAGLRPIQIWVPDTRQSSFAEECHRQSLLLKNDPLESEINDWLDEVRDTKDWK
ncbi:MAG: DUF3018 family protein [Burkholderiaceae bacterium]|nr:DUF3018 family protein [Burkholderiaceae bacterium]